jgi:hypothetical protein
VAVLTIACGVGGATSSELRTACGYGLEPMVGRGNTQKGQVQYCEQSDVVGTVRE